MKFYVPMFAKKFDMQESNSYDNMDDESFRKILLNPEVLDLSS